jgi:Trypsin-like peptidase domain
LFFFLQPARCFDTDSLPKFVLVYESQYYSDSKMTSLSQSFSVVRPAVVAFMPKAIPRPPGGGGPPDLFPIIGTGFVLDDGLVVTNAHVIDALLKLPRPPDLPREHWAFSAILFHHIDKEHHPNAPCEGYAQIPLEVLGIFRTGEIQLQRPGIYYGPRQPDFNIVHVKAKGLPKVELLGDTSVLQVGVEVATVGFPMGTRALTAPGWLHQLSPFLQRGVISAVLPFVCQAPHSFVINVMSIGGASGSPVFLTDSPKVIGILNAGLLDMSPTFVTGENGLVPIGLTQTPTNFSYVVPAFWLAGCVDAIKSNAVFKLPEDALSLDEIIGKAVYHVSKAPGHNEHPRPDEFSFEHEEAPHIHVEIKPTSIE